MAILLPSKFLEDDDRSLHVAHDESSLDAGNKPQQTLNVVHRGLIRAPSPDPSFISINDIQFDPDSDYIAVQHGRRDALQAPATAKGLKGKIQSFWIRNKGLALVLLAQFFGTLMNVTIRLLESEGNDGMTRMHVVVRADLISLCRQRLSSLPDPVRQNAHHCILRFILHVVYENRTLSIRHERYKVIIGGSWYCRLLRSIGDVL